MNKSEYRRALIMLRPRQSGCAGHVRLERRVMMGSLYFIVTAPEGGDLEAVLIGQRGGEYFAARLGALRRDGRGQATLAWSFDPRNIDGRPLDAYALVGVVRSDGDSCRLVLVGNVEGSRPMDMKRVEAAACAAPDGEAEPAADLPEFGEEEAPAAKMVAEAAGRDPDDPGTRIYTATRVLRDRGEVRMAREAEEQEKGDAKVSAMGEERMEPAVQAAVEEMQGSAGMEADANPGTAAAKLGLDADQPWTGALEPLQALFASRPEVATLEDDYVYVSAPRDGEEDALRVGLHATNGKVDGLRYAVRALYTEDPPEGMEGWTWVGDRTHGWWVTSADPMG